MQDNIYYKTCFMYVFHIYYEVNGGNSVNIAGW